MRVVVSVGGTWHAPHLSYQLQNRGALERIFTVTPPARFQTRAAIDRRRITWIPYPELVGVRLPHLLRIPKSLYSGSLYRHAVAFDKCVSLEIRRLPFDLFNAFAWYGLECLNVCKLRGIPTIIERGSAHTLARQSILAEEYQRLNCGHLYRGLDPQIIERELHEYALADYVSVPSQFAVQSFLDQGFPRNKLLHIPYGVDTERFRPLSEDSPRDFRVLTVGNLGVEKGTGYLLDSLELLRGLDIDLAMVGTLDAYITQRLQQTGVSWISGGAVPQSELVNWYHNASVYCLLSVQEGMSMTVLEAMACGVPVIASTSTGAADFITDGVDGFLVEPRDVQSVAEKLKRLYLDSDLRRCIGSAARRRALELTWDVYGTRLAETYSGIVCTD
jgi:glycosyltransferase involved in cell wall biosynthesis